MGVDKNAIEFKNLRVQFLIRNLIRDYHITDIDEEFITELVYNDVDINAEDISKRIKAKRRKGIIDNFLDGKD